MQHELRWNCYLCPQVIVEQFERSELIVHGLGVLRLLFLHDLPPRLYHRLHLKLHLTQQFVEFLHIIHIIM